MGTNNSKDDSKTSTEYENPIEVDHSTGFRFMEVHAPSTGLSWVFVCAVLICLAICYAIIRVITNKCLYPAQQQQQSQPQQQQQQPYTVRYHSSRRHSSSSIDETIARILDRNSRRERRSALKEKALAIRNQRQQEREREAETSDFYPRFPNSSSPKFSTRCAALLSKCSPILPRAPYNTDIEAAEEEQANQASHVKNFATQTSHLIGTH
jgi:hypothetical protein